MEFRPSDGPAPEADIFVKDISRQGEKPARLPLLPNSKNNIDIMTSQAHEVKAAAHLRAHYRSERDRGTAKLHHQGYFR